MSKHIDFNSDLAQSFGRYQNEFETELLDYVSSVNISCGFHAGDPLSIRKALLECKQKNIAIGAHIGFNDIQGFGYRPMDLDETEIEAMVIYQLGALASFAKTYNLTIEHVRPHGAMYKLAAENYEFSLAIAKAIQKFDKWLVYYGAATDTLQKVSESTGIIIAREIFANKIYDTEGQIEWNNEDNVPEDIALNRIRTLQHSSQMKLGNGNFFHVECDTIHFSSDTKELIDFAKKAKEIIAPTPVNFNKVEPAGWL